MTTDEIASRLAKLEEAVGEHSDALKEANNVRDQVVGLRRAVEDLAQALQTLPEWLQRQGNARDAVGVGHAKFNDLVRSAQQNASVRE